MKRAHKKWSEDEELRVICLYRRGHSWLEIGREIGRTAEAVRSRLETRGIARLKNGGDRKGLFAEQSNTCASQRGAEALVDQLDRARFLRSNLKRYYRLKPSTRKALADILLRLNETQNSSGITITVSNHPAVDQALLVKFLGALEEDELIVRVFPSSLIDRARGSLSKRTMKGTRKLEDLISRCSAGSTGRDED